MLFLTVNGKMPGDTLDVARGERSCEFPRRRWGARDRCRCDRSRSSDMARFWRESPAGNPGRAYGRPRIAGRSRDLDRRADATPDPDRWRTRRRCMSRSAEAASKNRETLQHEHRDRGGLSERSRAGVGTSGNDARQPGRRGIGRNWNGKLQRRGSRIRSRLSGAGETAILTSRTLTSTTRSLKFFSPGIQTCSMIVLTSSAALRRLAQYRSFAALVALAEMDVPAHADAPPDCEGLTLLYGWSTGPFLITDIR